MHRCYLCSVNKGDLTLDCGIHICGSCINLLPDEVIARVVEKALAPLKKEACTGECGACKEECEESSEEDKPSLKELWTREWD